MKKPVLLFFREVRPGDVKKHQIRSAVATTGGGARDLRLPRTFGPRISAMFPTKTAKPGITSGTVHWEDSSGHQKHKTVELWRPTSARPLETRIARIYEIDSWKVDEVEFQKARKLGQMWFFFLVKDSQGNVWARLFEEKNLEKETPVVRDFIKQRILNTGKSRAVCGVIDFEKNEVFPE
jgi:hypothetical protein